MVRQGSSQAYNSKMGNPSVHNNRNFGLHHLVMKNCTINDREGVWYCGMKGPIRGKHLVTG